jgi:trehalose 6-phosphate phosphatase
VPIDPALAPLLADRPSTGIFADFDGVLAEIVPEPDEAVAVDGAEAVLLALMKEFGLVAAVSGRPVSFLETQLPRSLVIVGLYGLEYRRRGRRHDFNGGGAWREVVADTAMRAEARGPEGMRVEDKGLSLTLHYRERPEVEAAVVAWAAAEAGRSGLVARSARKSVELHPPIEADKGTAIERLADKLSAVMYAGDDVGDLPAFDALDRLEERGLTVVRIAVSSPEAPAELLDRADLVIGGPADFVDLCRSLLDPAS